MITPAAAQQKFLRLTREEHAGVKGFKQLVGDNTTIVSIETQELLIELCEEFVGSVDTRLGTNTVFANAVSDVHNNTLDAGDKAIIAALTP